jgi:transcriptional regulator with XRE-family HTH domain
MFTEKLNTTRKLKGFTAQQMADLLGVAIRTYRYYESGRNLPSIYSLAKIANILEVSTDYLLGLTDNPSLPVKSAVES